MCVCVCVCGVALFSHYGKDDIWPHLIPLARFFSTLNPKYSQIGELASCFKSPPCQYIKVLHAYMVPPKAFTHQCMNDTKGSKRENGLTLQIPS